jgi:hypothetical protein
MACKYIITVTSRAILTGVTASLNNKSVEMIPQPGRRKYASGEVKRESDSQGKIEIDVHIRGRKDSSVTIKVENVTEEQEIFSDTGIIGSQSGSAETRYEVQDKKVLSKC